MYKLKHNTDRCKQECGISVQIIVARWIPAFVFLMHWLGHPENHFFSYWNVIITESTYPQNNSIYSQYKITAEYPCSAVSALNDTLGVVNMHDIRGDITVAATELYVLQKLCIWYWKLNHWLVYRHPVSVLARPQQQHTAVHHTTQRSNKRKTLGKGWAI